MTTLRRVAGVASLASWTIAGLAAAPLAFAQTAETGVITVLVFDDRGTPAITVDDVLTSAGVKIFGDDGDGSPIPPVLAEGQSTPDDPFVADGLEPGYYWIMIDAPVHRIEEPHRIELSTDPAMDCHVRESSARGCVAGDGKTIVSIGLGPPEGVRRITLAVVDDSGDDLWGGLFEARRDDGDGRLDPITDASVFGPMEDTEDDGFVTDQLEPGSYWVVEVSPPESFASARHGPVLVELNLDPTKACVAGDLEFWGGPTCDDGEAWTQVFFIYPPPTQRPATTPPPTDAPDGPLAERPGTEMPWQALAGLAFGSLGVVLLDRSRRSRLG